MSLAQFNIKTYLSLLKKIRNFWKSQCQINHFRLLRIKFDASMFGNKKCILLGEYKNFLIFHGISYATKLDGNFVSHL